jgi:hypothetical protein
MNGFLTINKIHLPNECLKRAYTHMRKTGMHGLEGVALFAGRESGATFNILEVIIPKQKSMRLETGLLYAVDEEELHAINVWLYNNNMSLIAQIHSHPSEAYHSDTDDAYPIVATLGGISIVVPDFASGPIDLHNCAVYRLSPDAIWIELNKKDKIDLFKV